MAARQSANRTGRTKNRGGGANEATRHEPADAPGRPVRGLRKAVFALVAVCLGILVALGIAEVAVRAFDLAPAYNLVFQENYRLSEDDVLKYELMPGSPEGDHAISSVGLRDREFTSPKPADVFRLALIGDSVTYGLFCKRDALFAESLERLLNTHAPGGSPHYEVLNMGVVGYNTRQVVQRLRVQGPAIEPDLVIYGYVLNDPQAYSLELESLRAMKSAADRSLSDALSRGMWRGLSHSRLAVMIKRTQITVDQPILPSFGPGFEAYRAGRHIEYLRSLHEDARSWSMVAAGLAELSTVASSLGDVPVLVAVFPISLDTEPDTYPLAGIHTKVMAEATRAGLKSLDLAPVFQAVEAAEGRHFFNDFMHLNHNGHDVAAVTLFKWLCESGSLPDPAPSFNAIFRRMDRDCRIAMILE